MIINGDLKLNETNITSIGKLKEVNGYLDLSFCDNLTSLGKLKYVKGLFLNLNFCYSLESLGNLKEVKGWLGIKNTNLKDLGKNCISRWLYLYRCWIRYIKRIY